MQVLTDLCDWKCSYAAGNNFMQVWTNLCDRKWSCATKTKFMQLTVGRNSILNFPAKITPWISRTFHGTSWKLMEQSQKEQGWRKRLISQPRGLAQTWHRNRVCFRPRLTTPTHQSPPGWPQSPDAPFPCSPINKRLKISYLWTSQNCWYQQTGPAQFGQNHPFSSFSPHQAI